MKMNHLTHNVSRLLSLLLVVAALAGLLTVGALAAPGDSNGKTVTASITNVTKTTSGMVTADVYLDAGSLDAKDGIVAIILNVDVPSGLELKAIMPEEIGTDASAGDVISLITSKSGYDDDFNKIFLGFTGGKIATLAFAIKDGAYGIQTIGFDISASSTSQIADAHEELFVLAQSTGSIDLGSATLTFDANGHGTAPDAQTVAVGGTVTAPTAPTATGYTFGGWYTDEACKTPFTFSALNENTTVYAKWTGNTVFVQLDANDGECESSGVNVTYGSAYGTLPEPVKTGYTFLGWYDDDTKIEADTKVGKTETHTLKAQWQINTYTVKLEPQGGTLEEKSVTRNYNEAYGALPTPTRDGFKFTGWFTGGEKVKADDVVVMDVTLYAQWVEKGQINLDKAPQTFTYEDTGIRFEVKVGEDDPKDGYTVSYWVGDGWTENVPENAGTYQVKVFHAAEGDFEELDISIMDGLVIEKAKVKEPAADTNVFTYDGTKKTYTVVENALYTVSDNEQTNAGEYKVTIALKDAANYKWETADNSEALEYDFVIAKAKVAAPTADSASFVYTGEEQTYTVTTSADYEVTGNKQKDAGTYTVTVSLKDTKNTAWTDGTTAAKEYTFTIAKAGNENVPDVKAENETIYKLADGKITGVDSTMEYSADNGVTWTAIKGSKLEDLKAGEYQVRYAESENYLASAAMKVTVGEGTKLTASFETNGGTEVEQQTGLGYKDALDSSKTTTTRTGYTFDGWYKDEAFKNAWDFATARMDKDDITLYAKWSYSVAVSGSDSFTTGSEPEDGLTIEIGKGLDLTKDNLKEVKVDGKKLDETDYTVSDENGLTVTLSKEFLATLKTGEHKVGIELDGVSDSDNAKDLSVSFTIKAKAAANGGTTGTGKKAPHTGDSSDLLLWSVVTLGAGAGLVCIGKKRREN